VAKITGLTKEREKIIMEKYGSLDERQVGFIKFLETMSVSGVALNMDFSSIANSQGELDAMEKEAEKMWDNYRSYRLELVKKKTVLQNVVEEFDIEEDEIIEEEVPLKLEDGIMEDF